MLKETGETPVVHRMLEPFYYATLPFQESLLGHP